MRVAFIMAKQRLMLIVHLPGQKCDHEDRLTDATDDLSGGGILVLGTQGRTYDSHHLAETSSHLKRLIWLTTPVDALAVAPQHCGFQYISNVYQWNQNTYISS